VPSVAKDRMSGIDPCLSVSSVVRFDLDDHPICMKYLFQFRRYRLPFRTVVRTAHGPWGEREGVIVRLEDERGAVGYGEAAVLPWFGTETADVAEAACREFGGEFAEERLAAVPEAFMCLKSALAAARCEISGGVAVPRREAAGEMGVAESASYLGIAALLPAGRAALTQITPKAEIGFRVFKWKVGVGDLADELALLDDVCAALPSGGKLRIDANGAWDRRQAMRWMERCADRPVEFVEQPVAADARGAQDVLFGLAGDYPTSVALDESLVGDSDVERWIGAGWPGIFVVKPSLIGNLASAMTRLAAAKADVVFSSALETAVGARTALRTAFAWNALAAEKDGGSSARVPEGGERDERAKRSEGGRVIPNAPLGEASSQTRRIKDNPPYLEPRRALGFGVWPLFADARFDGPHGAPFIRREDVERMNPDAVWKALG
jgi:O-succinylbenzoate synthase